MKKIICIFSAAAMLLVFSACGRSGNAASPGTAAGTSPTDIEIPEPTPTPDPQPVSELSVCGIPVVTNSQPTGITYKDADYKDGVLTLSGVDMVSDYGSFPAVSFTGNLEIVLVGDNAMTVSNGASGIAGGAEGDATASNLVISGDGTLTVTASVGDAASALFCTGTITVNGGELDLTGAKAAVSGFAGTGDQFVFAEGWGITHESGATMTIGNASAAKTE